MKIVSMLFFKKDYHIPVLIKHIAAWLCYCVFAYVLNLITDFQARFLNVIIYGLPFITVFYSTLFCLRLIQKRKIWLGITIFVCFFVFTLTIVYFFIYSFLPGINVNLYSGNANVYNFLQVAILGYVKFIVYALLFFFVERSIQNERQLRIVLEEKFILSQEKKRSELDNALLKQHELQSQKEKLQVEYAFLRAQINPHFLYNTLNALFAQALTHSKGLAENIMKLSNIMRYSLESIEFDSGKVFLQKELEHLQNLIEIHNIRFSNTLAIEYSLEGKIEDQTLPPFSIITIVENAFKYGDMKDPAYPLQIKISAQPKKIFFYCRNKKKKHNIDISSNNIGITNLSRRLDVLFENRYTMKATNDEDFYTFELTINNE